MKGCRNFFFFRAHESDAIFWIKVKVNRSWLNSLNQRLVIYVSLYMTFAKCAVVLRLANGTAHCCFVIRPHPRAYAMISHSV